MGPGLEMSIPGYRDSSRIIWDQQTVVNRLWERCALSAGLRELLATCPGERYDGPGHWEFSRLNDRMRFLKYTKGQFFLPHTDSPYYYEANGEKFLTFYTVHLYLNDSFEVDPTSKLVGGTTSFLSKDKSKRADVNPKAGSVLIFQHKGLYHEGAKVIDGIKYTMRTDILYQWVPAPKNG
ncbi:oxidoreductase [Grosmannia clavigera kw1407]|uniref:Oxidoreductase n=1 Tax=Grosmannia clavigera (strain kw1407 / UAMH 11150) TaxID=655863 RepID=F0X9J6_GROCL|nr:oxidoreductase [Grosmannia clavigera kw1407]EFX05392.1 oxidoreductase [Grosmannia clavigera kw1407]